MASNVPDTLKSTSVRVVVVRSIGEMVGVIRTPNGSKLGRRLKRLLNFRRAKRRERRVWKTGRNKVHTDRKKRFHEWYARISGPLSLRNGTHARPIAGTISSADQQP